jgi:hypothetical protein
MVAYYLTTVTDRKHRNNDKMYRLIDHNLAIETITDRSDNPERTAWP